MTKIQRKLIATSFCVSFASLVLCILSISTDNWLEATAVLTARHRCDVNYGLFGGTLRRHQLAATLQFDLRVACDFDTRTSSCIYSCQRKSTKRQDELIRILAGRELEPCEQARFTNYQNISKMSTIFLRFRVNDEDPTNPKTMDAGLWFSTVLFFVLSCACTTCAMGFSLLNLYTAPIERIFNISGLFIWNVAAAACSFLTLTIWMILFRTQLQHNIAVTDTLRQELRFSSEGRARVGCSYFVLLVASLLDVINVILLFLRRQIIRHAPKPLSLDQTIDPTRLEFY